MPEEEKSDSVEDQGSLTEEAVHDALNKDTTNASEDKKATEVEGKVDDTLPWDHARQQRDQQMANMGKAIGQLTEQMAKLLEKADQPAKKVGRTIKDVLQDLDDLEVPDEFGDEAEVKKYKTRLNRLKAELAKAEEGSAKKASKSTEKSEKTDKAEKTAKDDDDHVGQDEFREILAKADKQYGGQFRNGAVKKVQAVFKERGYADGKSPNRQTVEDIVFRAYAELAREKAAETTTTTTKKAKKTQKTDEAETFDGLGTASLDGAPTLEQAAEAMRKKRAKRK